MRILFCHWTWQDTDQKLLGLAVARLAGAQAEVERARAAVKFAERHWQTAITAKTRSRQVSRSRRSRRPSRRSRRPSRSQGGRAEGQRPSRRSRRPRSLKRKQALAPPRPATSKLFLPLLSFEFAALRRDGRAAQRQRDCREGAS